MAQKIKSVLLRRLIQWDKDDKKPIGEVISILNNEDANDMAMKEILAENGFPLSFADEVIEESERLNDAITEKEIKKRKDFQKCAHIYY